MNRKVLTIAKSTPGSRSREDFSLVKGNTKQKVLGTPWAAEARACRGARAPPPAPLRASLAALALSAKMEQIQAGTLRKQTRQGHRMCARDSHHRYRRCPHTRDTVLTSPLKSRMALGSRPNLHSGGQWTLTAHVPPKAPSPHGVLPLSKYLQQGRCSGGPFPGGLLSSHTACPLSSARTCCVCAAEERGRGMAPQRGELWPLAPGALLCPLAEPALGGWHLLTPLSLFSARPTGQEQGLAPYEVKDLPEGTWTGGAHAASPASMLATEMPSREAAGLPPPGRRSTGTFPRRQRKLWMLRLREHRKIPTR